MEAGGGEVSAWKASVEHRQWHSDLARWVYPDEPEYERAPTTLTEWLRAQLDADETEIFADYVNHLVEQRHVDHVLAQIAAVRAVVERYAWLADHGNTGDVGWVLPILAQPYAGRAGWDERWAL